MRHGRRRRNTLACTHGWEEVPGKEVVDLSLPHMPVIKDLVPDMTMFYAQYASIEPWLHTYHARAADTSGADPRRTAPSSTAALRVLLCACCTTSCPSYWWNSGKPPRPRHPAAGPPLAGRSRDEATGERANALEDPFKLYRCHTIMNCAQVRPKGLSPAKAIGEEIGRCWWSGWSSDPVGAVLGPTAGPAGPVACQEEHLQNDMWPARARARWSASW